MYASPIVSTWRLDKEYDYLFTCDSGTKATDLPETGYIFTKQGKLIYSGTFEVQRFLNLPCIHQNER